MEEPRLGGPDYNNALRTSIFVPQFHQQHLSQPPEPFPASTDVKTNFASF